MKTELVITGATARTTAGWISRITVEERGVATLEPINSETYENGPFATEALATAELESAKALIVRQLRKDQRNVIADLPPDHGHKGVRQ